MWSEGNEEECLIGSSLRIQKSLGTRLRCIYVLLESVTDFTFPL